MKFERYGFWYLLLVGLFLLGGLVFILLGDFTHVL